MFRLQKLMDEYAGGCSANFRTNKALLEKGLEYLTMLKEDSEKLGASNIYELARCWENIHRTMQAESHIHTVLFRKETRFPGYYFRTDLPTLDEENWLCFVNGTYDAATDKWEMKKVPVIRLLDEK